MAEKQWCKSEEEKKNAKNNNTRIVDSGKEKEMFLECFSVLGGVYQRTRNKKLRKVAEKYIYKRVFEYDSMSRLE